MVIENGSHVRQNAFDDQVLIETHVNGPIYHFGLRALHSHDMQHAYVGEF